MNAGARPSLYVPWLDRVGLWLARSAILSVSPERAIVLYAEMGCPLDTWSDAQHLPSVVREQAASALGMRWRRWLWVEAATSAAGGIWGQAAEWPALLVLMYMWAADLAFVYGLDPAEPERIERLRAMLGEELLTGRGHRVARGLAPGLSRSVLRLVADQTWWGAKVLDRSLWMVEWTGFGQKRYATERVMARVRGQWRAEADALVRRR